jgi:protease-4
MHFYKTSTPHTVMRFLFNTIKALFKAIFASLSFIRSLFFNLLFIGLIVILAVSFFKTEELVIPDNAILELSISGTVVEQKSEADPFNNYLSEFFGWTEKPRETLLQDVLDTVRQAQEDPKINGLLLNLKYLELIGLNQLEAIGAALNDFKQSGKPVISAEDYYSQDQYYLAAHGSRVFLNPMGGVNLHGYGVYRFYFKEALEKLKVDFHVFQVGSYKSALEPITRNAMSAEDRSQSRAWLTALWNTYVKQVAAQRSLKPEDISAYINRIPENLKEADGDVGRLALDAGLVDGLKTRQEIRSYLAEIAGDDEEPTIIAYRTYLGTVEKSYRSSETEPDHVALIVAQGTIVPGDSKPGTIGADTTARLLRKAREADHVKAVVLRVDSGGGSAFGSEIIRQEILELKKSGKPLVVSMGTYAASGGYWIAADADEIWASSSTLTGSIGIFMAIPTFEQLLEHGGIHRDGVGTTNLASGLDISQPLSREVSEALQLSLEHGYRQFVSVVAEGRNLPLERVEQLAQGRVYDGSAAVSVGLIDKIGSLNESLASAAALAGLDEYRITTLLPPVSLGEKLLNRIGAETKALVGDNRLISSLLKGFLPEAVNLQSFLLYNDPNGMYAHCMIDYLR